jgi:hypothetical protein
MKRLLVAGCLLLTSMTAIKAHAGFFAEPLLTYQDLKADISYPTTFQSDSSGEIKGVGVGARIGGHVLDTMFLAADLRYGKPTYKDSNFSAEAESANAGIVLGLQMPIAGLRIWGTYVGDGTLDTKEDNSVDFKFKQAKGHRIGLGLHVAMFSVNLEYENIKYDSTEIERLGPFTNVSDQDGIKLKQTGFVASVSFPISF